MQLTPGLLWYVEDLSHLLEEEMVCQMIENHRIGVIKSISLRQQLDTIFNGVHLQTEKSMLDFTGLPEAKIARVPGEYEGRGCDSGVIVLNSK